MKRGSKNWEKIILREWRYCEDREYTSELWQLVADQPARFAALLTLVLSGGLYFGPIGGLITGLLVTNWDIWQHPKHYRLVWDALVPFVLWGIAIGVVVGVLVWLRMPRVWTRGLLFSWGAPRCSLIRRIDTDSYTDCFRMRALFFVLFLLYYACAVFLLVGGVVCLLKEPIDMETLILLCLGPGALWYIEGMMFGLFGLVHVLAWGALSGLFYGQGVGLVIGLAGSLGAALAVVLGSLPSIVGKDINEARFGCFWLRPRPMPSEVEEAIQSAPHGPVWKDLLSRLEANRQHPPSVNSLIRSLQSSSWQERFLARHTLIALGGEIVEELAERLAAEGSESSLRAPLLDILRRIGDETKQRLAAKAKRLLCPRCLVRYGANRHRISWRAKVTYYGCRQCQQSREFMDWAGKIAVVLDREMTEESAERDGILRVNWFRRNGLFDFDVVEIVRASDEEVERFCIHVKNDGDRYRQRRYKRMRCVVSRGGGLRKQTLNMLKDMFGAVVLS